MTIEIRSPNGPPDIVSQPQTTAYAGLAYTYAAQATDPDAGDELKVVPARRSARHDDRRGRRAGGVDTGAGDVGGSFDVTIRVQDRRGLADLQSFNDGGRAPTPWRRRRYRPRHPCRPRRPCPRRADASRPTPTPTPVRVIASLAIEPASDGVVVGETRSFHAVATYADGSGADVSTLVTWGSVAPAIATVNAQGIATGVAPGTATIAASAR